MSQDIKVFEHKIKKSGYWKFSDLYGFCFDWLKNNGYSVKEKEYSEKVTDCGKEIALVWEAKKTVTDYVAYKIGLKWHILCLKDVEVERNGRREKTNKGEVKIEVVSVCVRDYEDKWDSSPFWKFLRGIYDRYIAKSSLDYYEDGLKDDSKEFVAQVKAFLELES